MTEMSEEFVAVLAALIAAGPPSILAYLAFVQARKTAAAAQEAKVEVAAVVTLATTMHEELKGVGLKVDGRFDKLVDDIRAVSFAEGRAEGVTVTENEAEKIRLQSVQREQDRAAGLAEGRAEVRQSTQPKPPEGTPP